MIIFKKNKKEYESNGIIKLFKEFKGLNAKSEGQLKDSSLKESFIAKFNNYFDSKFIGKILKKSLYNAYERKYRFFHRIYQ